MRLAISFIVIIASLNLAIAGDSSGDGPAGGKAGETVALITTQRGLTESSTKASDTSAITTGIPSTVTSSAGTGKEGSADSSTGPSTTKPQDENGGEATTPVDPIVVIPAMLGAAAIGVFLVCSVFARLYKHYRRQKCLHNAQKEFTEPNKMLAKLNQHLWYAPILGLRHNREFKLLGIFHMGTLPTRFEAILLSAYFVLNIVFSVATIDWSEEILSVKMDSLRNHTGTLAVVNLIPLVLTAGRNNPLIPLLQISFDTFNVIHRWLGRIVVIEGILHIIAVIITKVSSAGWGVLPQELWGKELVLYGFISIIAFVAISIQAAAPLRHAYYEFFLHLHIVLAILAFVTLWYHLEGLQQQIAMLGALVAWGLDHLVRFVNLIWRNVGSRPTIATIEILPGDCARLEITMARPWTFGPGQHMYLSIPSLGWWTSHPFSAAWSALTEDTSGKGAHARQSSITANLLTSPPKKTTISFLIRRRGGFTNKIFDKACRSPEKIVRVFALAEGPYSANHSLQSYGTVLLIAGGIGITHHIPYLRQLATGFANRTVATRRVTLVWVVRNLDHLVWVQSWMASILTTPSCHELLYIHIYVTTNDVGSEWSAIHRPWTHTFLVQATITRGKPFVDEILETEIESQVGAMAVSVCGPGSLGDDVRRAVRVRQSFAKIDLYEEAFSW